MRAGARVRSWHQPAIARCSVGVRSAQPGSQIYDRVEAQQHGFDPLLHQALLQVYGSDKPDGITVSALAQRLDIAPALASRLARQLAIRRRG